MNLKSKLQEIVDYSESNPFMEVCGFLGFDDGIEGYVVQNLENIAEDVPGQILAACGEKWDEDFAIFGPINGGFAFDRDRFVCRSLD